MNIRQHAVAVSAAEYSASLGPTFSSAPVAYATGRVTEMAGDDEGALAIYLRVFDDPASSAWPYLMNAIVQVAQRRGAESTTAHALAAHTERLPELHLWRGHLLRLAHRYDESIAALEDATHTTTGDVLRTAIAERARAFVENGDLPGAIEWCSIAMRKWPDDRALHQTSRAGLYNQIGNPVAGLADADAVLLHHPMFAEAHLNRASALLRLGDPIGADASFAVALRLSPGLAPTIDHLRRCLGQRT